MRRRRSHRYVITAGIALAASLAIAGVAWSFVTAVKPYTVPLGSEYEVTPVLSVGDKIPESSGAGQYQMIGIPDGLGATSQGGNVVVYMNHELTQSTTSEPNVGGPLNRGAFVSKLTLTPSGDVVSGERAYDTVYLENTLLGPAAEVGNATPAFSRFCSGNLAGPAHGFDRTIYFTNEETAGASTFDGKGGISVAVFDNKAYALPRLGHFAKENTLPQPRSDGKTVILSLEDGPTTPDSQLYMYVGTKDPSAGSPLARNGLDNGTLYVFVANDKNRTSEANWATGALTGDWVEISNAAALTDTQLEAAADAAGAFGFVRIEDGAFSKTDPNSFYFVTTGESAGPENKLGRLYELKLNPSDPTENAVLKIAYNADEIIAAGGDIAISPDNIDVSANYLMIDEDGTPASRPVMAAKGRDGSIWRFPISGGGSIDVDARQRVAQLNPPGRNGSPPDPAVGAGVWETSGVLDTSALFGTDSWLFDVQAHSPTPAPAPDTVEDGQLLLMTSAS
jgi:hypothetical protein